MTREEAIEILKRKTTIPNDGESFEDIDEAFDMAIKALSTEPCEDAISRQAVLDVLMPYCADDDGSVGNTDDLRNALDDIESLPPVQPIRPKGEWIPVSEKYERHIDHTDCIWYGNDSGCPVTCSQYRDGWNDAMDYIFKNGDGYRPYRRNENG